MDGIRALDLWDLVFEVWHSSSDLVHGSLKRDKQSRKHTGNHIKIQSKRADLDLVNVDYVSTNAKSSRSGAICIFVATLAQVFSVRQLSVGNSR